MIQRKAIEDIDSIYDSEQEQEALAALIEPRYLAVLNAVHELVVATFPAMEDFRLDDAATRRILERAAEQVVRIDDTTREAIREMLQRGQELGLSSWELANGSPKDDYPGISGLFTETWKGRAQLVARNELAIAQLEAAKDRYRATGLVDRLQLRDGTGSAPDEPCIRRNGTVVPLDSNPQQLHIACLPGDQVVLAPNCRGATARWFEGKLVIIRTASNDEIACTPNHPILTPRGWVAAQHLVEGEHVIRSRDSERLAAVVDPNAEQRPAMIEDVARAWLPRGATAAVPLTAQDFHGDAADGDICVIGTDRLLWDDRDTEHVNQLAFRGALLGARVFSGESLAAANIQGHRSASCGTMSGGSEAFAVLWGGSFVPEMDRVSHGTTGQAATVPGGHHVANIQPGISSDGHGRFSSGVPLIEAAKELVFPGSNCGSMCANREVQSPEAKAQSFRVNSDAAANFNKAQTRLIESACITEIIRSPFRGHVYNLTTDQGWYIAGGIVTHNCTLVVIPVLRGDPSPPPSAVPPVVIGER